MGAKVSAEAYLDCLVARPRAVSGTEAARTPPPPADPAAHDAYTRRLHRLVPDTATRWAEAAALVARVRGVLVLDDRVLDQPYAKQLDLVVRQWAGKHQRVVRGIGLVTLLWSDGAALIPRDYRVSDKGTDGQTKHDRARDLLAAAQARGCIPAMVLFARWHASLANVKAVRGHGWPWLTQLKANRAVHPDGTGNRRLDTGAIAEGGTRVHRQGDGGIGAFRLVSTDGDTEYWATSDLALDAGHRQKYSALAWGIAQDHRGLKQHCGVARAQVRAATAQRNQLACALRAFLRLEQHRTVTGLSWWDAKAGLLRDAIRAYRTRPTFTLSSTA